MLDKVREAIESYFGKYGRMPETVFMSESVFKQSAEESNPVLAAAFRPVLPTPERPVTIYGANVEIIPYPDDLLIIGGVRVIV